MWSHAIALIVCEKRVSHNENSKVDLKHSTKCMTLKHLNTGNQQQEKKIENMNMLNTSHTKTLSLSPYVEYSTTSKKQ